MNEFEVRSSPKTVLYYSLALGDELDLEDSSYLDDAVATPSVPSSEPGADSMRVRDYFKSPKMAAFELELILFERLNSRS
jgi:hypothetical protein